MLTFRDLGFHSMKDRLREKSKISEQPISDELSAVMVGHMQRRGTSCSRTHIHSEEYRSQSRALHAMCALQRFRTTAPPRPLWRC